ncbi:MAG: hypothetical protein AAF399_30365 [Bacteroidota bacterium]
MRLFSFFLAFFLTAVALRLSAQPYVEGGNTRHRFAQLTVGAEALYTFSGGQIGLLENGTTPTPSAIPASLRPRLSIGGTHFWGHAEIYVAFDLPNLLSNDFGTQSQISYSPGVETAFKVYPWRLERGKVRPFVGTGFSVPGFRLTQGDQRGTYFSRSNAPLNAGLTYQTGNLMFEVGARYQTLRPQPYFISRSIQSEVQLPPWSTFVGIRYQIETTGSAEKPYLDGRTDRLEAALRKRKKLSAFSIAAGPSASFVVAPGRSTYNTGSAERAFVDNHKGSNIFFDLGVGYYYEPWDAHLNVAHRRYSSQIAAYDYRQAAFRRSWTLEGFKFLFDYHGFVPFIGPSVNLERWILRGLEGDQEVIRQEERRVLPGITFGWDIRPDKVQSFILRTNLRYTPYVMDTPGNSQVFLHQLEFNFIQLVIYPSRMRAIRKLTRRR